MAILKFSDGEEFNTQGPIRKDLRKDGWYVIGRGLLIPVESEAAADEMIKRLGDNGIIQK